MLTCSRQLPVPDEVGRPSGLEPLVDDEGFFDLWVKHDAALEDFYKEYSENTGATHSHCVEPSLRTAVGAPRTILHDWLLLVPSLSGASAPPCTAQGEPRNRHLASVGGAVHPGRRRRAWVGT
jgi:hypothetical protein